MFPGFAVANWEFVDRYPCRILGAFELIFPGPPAMQDLPLFLLLHHREIRCSCHCGRCDNLGQVLGMKSQCVSISRHERGKFPKFWEL